MKDSLTSHDWPRVLVSGIAKAGLYYFRFNSFKLVSKIDLATVCNNSKIKH
jgi:hypothetical protein